MVTSSPSCLGHFLPGKPANLAVRVFKSSFGETQTMRHREPHSTLENNYTGTILGKGTLVPSSFSNCSPSWPRVDPELQP